MSYSIHESEQPQFENSTSRSKIEKLGRWIIKLLRAYFIGVGILATCSFILFSLLLVSLFRSDSVKRSAPSLGSEKLILQLDLSGILNDKPQNLESQMLSKILGDKDILSMQRFRQALRRATEDERVVAVYVKLGSLAASTSNIVELRRLLQNFRDVGKKVYAWSAAANTQGYYLLSVADHIALAPLGDISIPGPVFQLTYFGEALRKLGIDIEVLRAGKYKSAFEPFIANEPSPEVKEMYGSMEESIRSFYIEDIAANRSKPVETVRAWLQRSLFTSADAKAEGLVDQLQFADEVEASIVKEHEATHAGIELMSLKKYLRGSFDIDERNVATSGEAIAFIRAHGNIVMGSVGNKSSDSIEPEQFIKEVNWARTEDQVKAVVLQIDSPGGAAIAADIMWRELARLSSEKPLVVSMSNLAASGGYYLAAPANAIYAEPTTITGSIGVIGMVPNLEAFKAKYGVSFYTITQSDRAALLNPGSKSTAFDKALVENGIETTYQTFLQRVAEGRKMTVEQVHELAQGRVYNGRQALELKLVDDLGGLNEAFQKAKELAGLDVNKLYTILEYEGDRVDFAECILSFSNFRECLEDLEATSIKSTLFSVDLWQRYFSNVANTQLKYMQMMFEADERILAIAPELTPVY